MVRSELVEESLRLLQYGQPRVYKVDVHTAKSVIHGINRTSISRIPHVVRSFRALPPQLASIREGETLGIEITILLAIPISQNVWNNGGQRFFRVSKHIDGDCFVSSKRSP